MSVGIPHSGSLEALLGPDQPLGERIGIKELSELEILTTQEDSP